MVANPAAGPRVVLNAQHVPPGCLFVYAAVDLGLLSGFWLRLGGPVKWTPQYGSQYGFVTAF